MATLSKIPLIKNQVVRDSLESMIDALAESEKTKKVELPLQQVKLLFSRNELAKKMNRSPKTISNMLCENKNIKLQFEIKFLGWYEEMR